MDCKDCSISANFHSQYDSPQPYIEFCPLHENAGELLEATKAFAVVLEDDLIPDSLVPAIRESYKLDLARVKAAIAKTEGRK